MISVIIPVYNNEKYFPKAIESILSQDYEDYEVIIVDDGSTDNTGKMADAYAEQDSRIKVIHQENQWIYASFNRGVQEASGEYVYILNSDDKLRPNILGILNEKIEKYHPDVIWTIVLTHICDEEQSILVYDKYKINEVAFKEEFYDSKDKVRKAWPFLEETSLAHNQANLYKRELLLAHPFRNDVYGADVLFNISLAPEVEKALVLDIPVYDHFIYNKPEMNASVGKYYTYEHDMFNEIYNGFISLFESWDLDKDTYEKFLSIRKMKELTVVINKLKHSKCSMTINEKIRTIFNYYVDDTMLSVTRILDAQEELESRVLSGVRGILVEEALSEADEMYFVYEMLEALLCYEKDDVDMQKIEAAIQHPLNPKHIGKTFYEKILNKKQV